MDDRQKTQGERLNELALYLDMSVRKLAQFCGLSTATVYHITDNSQFVMSERTASRICYQLEKKEGIVVNRQWLLTGEGEMIDRKLSVKPYQQDEGGDGLMAAEGETPCGEPDYREKYFKLLEEYSELQKKYSVLMERCRK